MTDRQLYILVAIPLAGILANTGLFVHLSSRVDRLGDRMDNLTERMDAKFDVITGKVVEVANRLTRLQERMGSDRSPT